MVQSSEINETGITIDALRELGSWSDVLRKETRLRACETARELGNPVVTSEILREAIVAACNEIVKRIRSESQGDRNNDIRAA